MGFFSSNDSDEVTLVWEDLSNGGRHKYSRSTQRSKVPGGWLVGGRVENEGYGLTFLPDPNHEWDGTSLD